MRLAKYLAHGGVASRRKAEEIIAKGVVTVGGEVVVDPARDVDDGDDVRVNGAPVGVESLEVWAINKPAGVVSTAREPGERQAVVELVHDRMRAGLRVFRELYNLAHESFQLLQLFTEKLADQHGLYVVLYVVIANE